MSSGNDVAVVIPCYKVSNQILNVISRIGSVCSLIYIVDDACPERSGDLVEKSCSDPRVRVLRHKENQGVGGAVLTGYLQAYKDGASIIVKIDGDGQMAPELITDFISPIINGEADYTKGNRFYVLEDVQSMPPVRIFGNAVLSIMSKLSSGYWNVFDPTNGYTAINANAVPYLPVGKISKRYFFESDMLFRLNTLRAVVLDVPMSSVYGDEKSNLIIRSIVFVFLRKHVVNFFKRIFYNYFLRDMSVASVELLVGVLLVSFGSIFGGVHWFLSVKTGISASAGTVMIAGLSIMTGLQLLLSFLNFDVRAVPTRARFSVKLLCGK